MTLVEELHHQDVALDGERQENKYPDFSSCLPLLSAPLPFILTGLDDLDMNFDS